MIKNFKKIISFVEAIYIIYMLNYFKTTVIMDSGLILYNLKKLGIKSKYFNHQITKIDEPMNLVCPFGNLISWFIGAFFILRNYSKFINKYNKYIIILIFIGSLMNFNVVVYLLPVFIIELYLGFYTS